MMLINCTLRGGEYKGTLCEWEHAANNKKINFPVNNSYGKRSKCYTRNAGLNICYMVTKIQVTKYNILSRDV